MKNLENFDVTELSLDQQQEIFGGYDFGDFVDDVSYGVGAAVGTVIVIGVAVVLTAKQLVSGS